MEQKCQNSEWGFNVDFIPGATYLWTIPGVYAIVAGSLVDNAIIVNWSDNSEVGTKQVNITVTHNGCTFTDTHTVQVTACPCNGFDDGDMGNCANGEICCNGDCTVPPNVNITVT